MSTINFSQEKWNKVLDLIDENKRQQQEINKLNRVVKAQQETLTKLQKEVASVKSPYGFDFKGFNEGN